MRVAGFLLALITLLVLAPLAPAAQAPTPDAAPGSTPAPHPDPAPGAAPASSAPLTSAPATPAPPPTQPAQPAAPAPAEAATDLPASTSAGPAQPGPAPTPPARRRAEREKPAPRPVPTPEEGLPLLHLAASSASDASGPLARAGLALLLLVVVGAASLRLTLRLVGPLALLLVLAAPASAQAAPTLDYACRPAPANCSGWYRTAVELRWNWDQLIATPTAGTCGPRTFPYDTPGTETFCEIQDTTTLEKVRRTLTIRIDSTPPAVTAAVPDRPPDSNNWFNHPVTFTFQGGDATSGVASCSSGTFAGPEGEGVSVAGSCTDVAGNVRTAAFPLNYDSTRPGTPDTEVIPGDNLVRFDWSLPRGAVAVEVARVLPGEDEVVYTGQKSEVVDRGLKNGVRHRYRVTAVDRAGNRASARESAVPTTADLLTPAAGEHVNEPPLLAWKQVHRASYYNVQLYRGRRKVLTEWPRSNRLQLKKRWRFAGQRRRLKAGRYTWYVWPGLGKRVDRRYGRVLGKSSFTVTR